MTSRYDRNTSTTTSLLALAAFFQSQLQVVCQTAEFFPAGRRGGGAPVSTTPSSLITIQPFAPGGLRRLCLNVHSKLIQQLATILADNRYYHDDDIEDLVVSMGRAMISSASWPVVPGIDGGGSDHCFSIHWKMPRGLIATPEALCVWPVPHQEVVMNYHCHHHHHHHHRHPMLSRQPLHTALAIWPRRICRVQYQIDRGDPVKQTEPVLEYVAAVWSRRDEALHLEMHHLLLQSQQKKRRCSWWLRRLGRGQRLQGNATSTTLVEEALQTSSLLTYAPSLPIFCVARALQHSKQIPRHLANAEAAAFLVQNDRLFALSLFFGVPLIDRTRTLHGALRTAPLVRPPPTHAELQQFQTRHSKDPHTCLKEILLQRARELWNMTETKNVTKTSHHPPGNIYVAWSGGIDSTTVLCALLQTAQNGDTDYNKDDRTRMQRIRVVLDDKSIAENPLFYQKFIQPSLQQIPRNDKALSWHEANIRQENPVNIFVTGELGDQLFGSDRCAAAFPEAYGGPLEKLPPRLAKSAPKPPPPDFQGVFCDKGLAAPWQETMLPSLNSVGLLAEGCPDAWQEWIAPQLMQAPFPIVSTYDFFWWLNFSMKWQNVSLRCLHDGGKPLVEQAKNLEELTGCIHHFFDDRDMECWSCIREFHLCKFPDLTNWTTYKEPLKYFIREFDGNEDFYKDKMKVGSLGFGAPFEADSYVNRFYGALAKLEAPPEQIVSTTSTNGPEYSEKICRNARPHLLSWGACGLLVPESKCLLHLLHPDMRSALLAYPNNASKTIVVDPWIEGPMYAASPFDVAPFFAANDERQRRTFNPVTEATLVGKCAALLEANLLKDRTFLDLGACLGASTHWALCMGVSHATAVEIQENFCDRARDMLKRAEALNCWSPSPNKTKSRFNIVQSGIREYLSGCADGAYDIVLAAGLLHCFLDPIQVLMEMARVAAHAVLIEMLHPVVYLDGYLDDSDSQRSYTNKLGLGRDGDFARSVRPLCRRIEQGGLLQIAPHALVNMADNDASFQGLAILPSRLAIESVMKNLGFEVTRVMLKDHPTVSDDVVTYTEPRTYRALPSRYFLRCVRIKSTKKLNIRSLESVVSKDDKSEAFRWREAKSWSSWDSSCHSAAKNADSFASRSSLDSIMVDEDPSKKWEFDKSVAKRFEQEAKCHIPDYEEVVHDSISLVESDMEKHPSKGTKEALKIVDIGCATGYTLLQLCVRGFRNVHGVDISAPMLETARDKIRSAGCEEIVNLHLSQDPISLPRSLGNDLDFVFVNWTLQFVPAKENRKLFLYNISKRMKDRALLVLTEKTIQDSLTKDAYYAFKKKKGVTEKEIKVKEAKLKGVLEPFPLDWYLTALSECGFSQVSLFRARFGFVTFLARREARQIVKNNFAPKIRSDGRFATWINVSKSARGVFYQTMEQDAPFAMKAWGESTNSTWTGGSEAGTVYGFVFNGATEIIFGSNQMSFTLHKDMYFACPGHVKIHGGCGVLFTVENHRAMFALGGPIEAGEGRLPYIDGCTDSLLLSPATKGAPCLNHLHFPPGIVQTRHTHPSGRAGIVIRGKGVCVYDNSNVSGEEQLEKVPLEPGMAFVIPAHLVHAFETAGDQELDVVAFHPDSDFGPSSINHPMINRTIVNGISASAIDSIQTKRRTEE